MTDNERRYFVPAAPGFWELSYLDAASGGPEATRVPVVAWEIIDDGVSGDAHVHYAYPVTTFGEVTGRGHNPILGSDGYVRVAGGVTWDSERQWLEDKKKEERRATDRKETMR
jgi:hypothetical protein